MKLNFIRDALMHSLMKGSNLDLQAYSPAIVFVNGEYWGVHNIRERLDHYYFMNKYGISKDSIAILGDNNKLYHGSRGDERHYSDMLGFIKANDISLKENYDYLNTLMDTDNFMDYMIAGIYFANFDWPGNNVKLWRKKHPRMIRERIKGMMGDGGGCFLIRM